MTSETENMKLEHDRLLQNLQTDSQALKLLKSENEQVQQTMKLLKDELEAKKQTLNEVDARLAGHAELDREIREKTAKKQDLENQQQNLTQLVVQMQGVILSREQQLGNINAQIMELKDDVEKLEDKKKTLTNENASLAYEQRGIVRKNNDLEAYQARLNELTYGAKVKYRDSIIQPAFGPRH
jgi:chromosome segregation ATPase